MNATRTEIELWACIDSNGDHAVGTSDEAAREKYEEDVGPLADASGFRLVKVTVSVPLPEPFALTGEVAEEETASLKSVT